MSAPLASIYEGDFNILCGSDTVQYGYGNLNVNNICDTTEGYFFGKLIDINKSNNKIKYSLVKDSTLIHLKNADEVRQRIKENLNNPNFYSDTAYFKKIKK